MKFKIMTWNVENFFPVGVGAGPKTPAEYDAKLANLAAVIQGQDPDVIALQEVGDQGHAQPRPLTDLANKLGGTYRSEVSHHSDTRGIRVALLVRSTLNAAAQTEITQLDTAPPLNFQSLDGTPLTEMGRGAIHLRVQVANQSIHVITAHLKSKLLEFPGNKFTTKDEDLRVRVAAAALARRCAEAAALRMRVTTLRKNTPNETVILLGDLNDGPAAATTEMLYGPSGSQPDVGQPGTGFDKPDEGDAQRLFNVTGLIPPDRRYSRIFQGKKELIDHILVSVNMVPQKDPTHKVHPQVDSLVDYGAQGAAGGLPSVSEDPHERQGKPASDHAPVVATFDI